MLGHDTIDARIRKAGWFKGTEADWGKLSHEQRKDVAFKGCGCEVAYPTWEGPVDCVHIECQIRRGEKKPLILTNQILREELRAGWLRFNKESVEGRRRVAQLIRACRQHAIATGIYDPWKMEGGWAGLVQVGIGI